MKGTAWYNIAMNLRLALQKFLIAMTADGLKQTTLDWYAALLTPFIERHEPKSLTDVTTDDLRNYLVYLRSKDTRWEGDERERPGRLSPDTISAHTRALHKFWSWAATEYQIANPMRSIKYPRKPPAKPKAISLEDVALLYAATGDDVIGARNRAILALLIDTGCRAGGLVGLRLEDVDIERRRATVTEKGDKTRTIFFTQWTADVLKEWIDQRQPAARHLFYNAETFQPLTVSGLRGILKRLAKRAGVTGRVNPHSFRHCFAREYLKNGGNLATLSKEMGHRDTKTTIDHYTIYTDDEIAQSHEQHSPVHWLRNKNAPDDSEAP